MVKNADSGQQENLGANKLTRLKQTLTTGLQQAQDSGLSFIFIFFIFIFLLWLRVLQPIFLEVVIGLMPMLLKNLHATENLDVGKESESLRNALISLTSGEVFAKKHPRWSGRHY